MNIGFTDKLAVLAQALPQARRMPGLRRKMAHLLCPVDSTRYTEFAYLLRFLRDSGFRPRQVLDVSSPFGLAYILSGAARVIKTDINPAEAKNICEDAALTFKQEDAARLTFADGSFDLVYSISVIEHIYDGYRGAVREMLRVLRPGGYLYLTFPVAERHLEEWLDGPIYSHQLARNGQVFFQYRFGEEDVTALVEGVDGAEVVDLSIYWERRNGGYDRIMRSLLRPGPLKFLHELRNGLINLWAGFTLIEDRPADFSRARSFGNASLLLRKRSGGEG